MAKIRTCLLLSALLGFSQAPSALAQFLDSDMGSSDAAFQQDTANFGSSLDSAATNMRSNYDSSQQAAANRYLTNMQANQDTMQASEQAFQNTQQEMVMSGGAYNSQGFMWGGLGGWGGGGGFGNATTTTPVNWGTMPSGGFSRPSYGGGNSVLSRYYGSRSGGGQRGLRSE